MIDEPFAASRLGPPLRDHWSADSKRVLRAHRQRPNFKQLAEATGHPELAAQ